jgi:hypothetical protein
MPVGKCSCLHTIAKTVPAWPSNHGEVTRLIESHRVTNLPKLTDTLMREEV